MSFSNRTYDNTVSTFVAWSTPAPDPTGAAYPGPGVFGVDTTGYAVSFVPEPGGAGGNVYIYNSLATPSGNLYNSWAALYADASSRPGTAIIELATDLTIPAGLYGMGSVKFRGINAGTGNGPLVTFDTGCQLFTTQFEAENVQITTVDPLTPPCYAERIGIELLTLKATMTVPLFGLTAPSVPMRSRDLIVELGGGKLMNLTGCTVTLLCEGLTQFDNAAITGDGASSLFALLTSASTALFSDLPVTMPGLLGTYQVYALSRADKVFYDDTLATPQLGATTPQAALDIIKPWLGTAFVYAPGFTPGGNIYDTWSALHAAVNAAPMGSRKVIVTDAFGAATVPSGAWRMRGWDIEGRRKNELNGLNPSLTFDNGATLDTTPDAGVDSSWHSIRFSGLRVVLSQGGAWWSAAGDGRESVHFTDCRVDGSSVLISAPDGLNPVTVYLRNTEVNAVLVDTNTTGAVVYKMDERTAVTAMTIGSGQLEYQYDDTCAYEDPTTAYLGTSQYKSPVTRRKYWVPAGNNVTIAADPGTNEVVVGGFAYKAFDDFPAFHAMITTPAVVAVVKLYDIGPVGTLSAPVLRSTLTILGTGGYAAKVLTRSAAPGVNLDEIYGDAVRMYEVRVVADASEQIYLYSTGLVVDTHNYLPGPS